MEQYQQPPEGKDPAIWELAKKRADFKSHLISYVLVNAFFWAIWFFAGTDKDSESFFPWPVWATLGWGIGLAYCFAEAYIFPKHNAVEREYQKLKNKQ